MNSVFVDISIILSIAIGIAFVVRLLRQPLLISYLFTGIVCGPLFLDLINPQQEFFDIFAKFGVVLLLFLVGLNLNFDYLKKIGKVAVVTGISQVIFTSSLGFFILWAFGFSVWSSLFLAVAITFSSTIIITKLLSDKGDIRSVYGRYTVGLMLVQDVVAVVIMILLPALRFGDAFAISLIFLILKSLAFLLGVYLVTRLILPVILNKVAESEEFLLIFALAWCFTVSGLAEWAGLSLEVGAIVAGLSLAAFHYQWEIGSRVKPLRDFFIVIFFVILGSEMNVANIQEILWPGLAISVFILVGNPLILYMVFRLMKFTRKNSFLSGLTAAQVSEFGFVFLFVSQDMGLIGETELSLFTLVALTTIFLSSYLIPYNRRIFAMIEPWIAGVAGKDKVISERRGNEECYDVLVFGYHRLGWKVCDSLKRAGLSFAVVDFDPAAVKKLKSRGIPYYFGDASDPDFLEEIFSKKTKLVISTLPDFEDQTILLRQLRRINKKAIFVGNLSHTKFLDHLYGEGADFVIVPHLLAGSWMAELLEEGNHNRHTFRKLRNHQKRELKLRYTLGHH